MHTVHRSSALGAEWLVIQEVEEVVAADKEITKLWIKNSYCHKLISSICISVESAKKLCSRRVDPGEQNQLLRLLPQRMSELLKMYGANPGTSSERQPCN